VSRILKSFIEINSENHFPIQNLPFGVFRTVKNPKPRVGVAIGDFVLDLSAMERRRMLSACDLPATPVFDQPALNAFMKLGRPVWRKVRRRLQELLSAENPELRDNAGLRTECLIPMSEAEMLLPVEIGDYTDFYSSKEHATNVGIMFRGKDNALMPNWLHLPVAYHGRAGSVVVSGTDIRRPKGQTRPDDSRPPQFGPSRLMDFELEMGFFIGPGSELGEPVPVDRADEHIFGMALVNDWSARDIQKWEYQPLGPFLAKNFATSMSPWIVTLEALEPFRVPAVEQEPEPLPYLSRPDDWTYDIKLQVGMQGANRDEEKIICRSNFRYLYWTINQQLAHHTVTGCNMRPGDMLASGTISGPTEDSYGSLLELTWRGSKPIELADGELRKFIEDHDRITMRGWCQGDGYRVGFGEVTGKILPAE